MFEYWGGYNIGCKQWVVVLAIPVIEKKGDPQCE
jgi:hypothetical protein